MFGRFSILISGLQVFLCKTHPYGRLEACWDWGPGGPGTGDLLTDLLNVIFIHTSECLWLQFNVLSFLWRFNAQVSELVANLTSSEWLDNTRAKISDTKTVHTINIITINTISHPFFEQWYLPFRRELFCFWSKFKNKNSFKILVQFPNGGCDLKIISHKIEI